MRILYIDIDSLNPGHLGCYGYHRNTSPNIDAVAARGTRFDNCYVSDAPCLPSRTALYTGRFGLHTGLVAHGGTGADLRIDGVNRGFQDTVERTCLPGVLQRGGMHTAMVSSFGQRHAARHFYAGFNEIFNPGYTGMDSAEQVLPSALRWLKENASRDQWYFHVNFWDPHTPYRWPKEYGNRFADEPLGGPWTDEVLARHLERSGPHSASDLSMFTDRTDPKYPLQLGAIRNRADLKQHIDTYDTAIHYTDDAVGQLLAVLEKAGVLDDTAVIISADHGENQGELGIYAEHATADRGTCRIPLIVHWPGMKHGASDAGLHYHLDLGPTMTDLLGLAQPEIWDGASYANSLRSGADCGRDHLVISQCVHVCQRSVLWKDWLYMRTWHDGFHPFPEETLFDLARDPFEHNDLAPQSPEICSEAQAIMDRWKSDLMTRRKIEVDPLWTVMKEGGPFHASPADLPAYLKRLETTGRGPAAQRLRARHLPEEAR